jgi:hypothetical protein
MAYHFKKLDEVLEIISRTSERRFRYNSANRTNLLSTINQRHSVRTHYRVRNHSEIKSINQ